MLLLRLQPGEMAPAAHRCSLESVGVIILMSPSNLRYSIVGLLFSLSSSVSSLQVAVESQRLGEWGAVVHMICISMQQDGQ